MPTTTARQTEVVTEAPLVRVANRDLREDDVIVLISESGWSARRIAFEPSETIDGGQPVFIFPVAKVHGGIVGRWIRPVEGFSYIEARHG